MPRKIIPALEGNLALYEVLKARGQCEIGWRSDETPTATTPLMLRAKGHLLAKICWYPGYEETGKMGRWISGEMNCVRKDLDKMVHRIEEFYLIAMNVWKMGD